MGRKLRTTVPVVPSSLDPQWSYFQDARKAQCDNKQRQKKAFDKRHRVVDLRPLKPGEHVWVKDMNRPIELDEGVDAPVAVGVPPVRQPPEPRRNHVRARKQPSYLSDYNVSK